ncbi:MAG TPA: hypothetical protein VLI05_06840 [Candidatus Saccharimonadia bacterium]|nr:hypothetical protein [Candidatus Saccharimonadia bacterium]
MALTQTDIGALTTAITVALEPRFARIDKQISEMRQDITELRQDVTKLQQDVTALQQDVTELHEGVDTLAAATKEQFDIVVGNLEEIKEDVVVVKDIVKDHGFRLARLEHRAA